jgi:hypothetical protein
MLAHLRLTFLADMRFYNHNDIIMTQPIVEQVDTIKFVKFAPNQCHQPRLDKMHHINGTSDIESNMNNSHIWQSTK